MSLIEVKLANIINAAGLWRAASQAAIEPPRDSP
jgi:hypothetical protein